MDPAHQKKQKVVQGIAQNSPQLTGVKLKFTLREDAAAFFKALASNTVCTTAKVIGAGLDDKSVSSLASCLAHHKSLTYIDISDCRLTYDGLKDLASGIKENRTLTGFRLGPIAKAAPRMESGIEHLFIAIAERKILNRFELTSITLLDPMIFAKVIAKHLPRSHLKCLLLDHFNFTEEAFQVMGPAIISARSLTVLFFNRLVSTPPIGVRHLLKPLNALPLTRLSLSGTNLRELDLMAIVGNEIANRIDTLQTLELSGCKISTDGAAFVFESITKNRPLTKVDLSDNDIATVRTLSLGKHTTVLTDLSLAGNKLSEETLSHLSQELPANRTLTRLNLSRNSFLPDSARQFLNPVLLGTSKLRELIIDEASTASPDILSSSSKRTSPTSSGTATPGAVIRGGAPILSRLRGNSTSEVSQEEDYVPAAEAGSSEDRSEKKSHPNEGHEESPEYPATPHTPKSRKIIAPLQLSKHQISKSSPAELRALKQALATEIVSDLLPQIKDLVIETLKKRVNTLPPLRDIRTIAVMEQQSIEHVRAALFSKLSA